MSTQKGGQRTVALLYPNKPIWKTDVSMFAFWQSRMYPTKLRKKLSSKLWSRSCGWIQQVLEDKAFDARSMCPEPMPAPFCSTHIARHSRDAGAAATVDSPGTKMDGDGSGVLDKLILLPILDDSEHVLLDLEVFGLLQVDISTRPGQFVCIARAAQGFLKTSDGNQVGPTMAGQSVPP